MVGAPCAVIEPVPEIESAFTVTLPPDANSVPSVMAPTGDEEDPDAIRAAPAPPKWALMNAGALKKRSYDQSKGAPPGSAFTAHESEPVAHSGIVMFSVR